MLIRIGANVNCDDFKSLDGFKPLHWAVFYNNLQLVELLVKHKASVNAQTNYGETPIHMAITKGRKNILKILLEKGSGVNLYNCLFVSITSKNIEIVKMILDAGIRDVHLNGLAWKPPPLLMALKEKQMEIAKLLIEKGARVDVFDAILMGNQDNDQLDMIQMLILRGADVTKRHQYWNITPLFYAMDHNLDDIVKLLISHGADTSMKDFDGNSLLHLAVKDQKIGIVKTFVEAEKCLHEKNLHGLKPLEYELVLRQNLKIAKLFIYLN